MDSTFEALIILTRAGIWRSVSNIPKDVNWESLQTLATKHGLAAVVLDGIEQLKNQGIALPDKAMMIQWIGAVLQNYEQRFKLYRRAIAELARFYNGHDIKMMVLKGYACSLDWPKPEHRPCGDIDIWQFGQQKEADELLNHTDFTESTDNSLVTKTSKNSKCSEIVIDNSHHHHTVFDWKGFMVENHYDFINVHHHRSNADYEKILKQLGDERYTNDNDNLNPNPNLNDGLNINANKGMRHECVDVDGAKVYLPSPNLHALFLLKHMMLHFASEEINLRQILDWAFFVKAHGEDVDWAMVKEVMEKFGMSQMFCIINRICVDNLGFDFNLDLDCDMMLKERVLNEVLSPEFTDEAPSSFLPRLAFKYKRWRANEWKHRLCYNESMWSAFWSGVWNHMLKPKSI